MNDASVPDGSGLGRDALKAERVYAVLRRRIRDLELPPGTFLKKDDLAAEFGVSRAPVSEAFARLAEERLVDVFPQHGSFVSEIRLSDLREGLFIRMGLETEAVREVARARDAALVGALDANIASQVAALAAGDLRRLYELDEALHACILAAVGHERTRRFLDSARAALDRVRRLTLPEPGRPEATLAEHQALVEAIRAGDGDAAAAAMRAHLLALRDSIDRQIGQDAAAADRS